MNSLSRRWEPWVSEVSAAVPEVSAAVCVSSVPVVPLARWFVLPSGQPNEVSVHHFPPYREPTDPSESAQSHFSEESFLEAQLVVQLAASLR